MRHFILMLICIGFYFGASAQKTIHEKLLQDQEFFKFQMQFDKVSKAYSTYYNSIKKQFADAGLQFPIEKLYIRAFKQNQTLEAWVKVAGSDTFLNFKTFRVCGTSGTLGPKRQEGDHQIPEGAYFIDEFNPKSNYYLSLLINYPNYSDLINTTNPRDPGGEIYIHGSCATVGCIPINDEGIKELYLLSMIAKANGQLNIPVHIFPVRYNQAGMQYLGSIFEQSKSHIPYWLNLKKLYDYFEEYHKVPTVMYDEQGNYLVEQ